MSHFQMSRLKSMYGFKQNYGRLEGAGLEQQPCLSSWFAVGPQRSFLAPLCTLGDIWEEQRSQEQSLLPTSRHQRGEHWPPKSPWRSYHFRNSAPVGIWFTLSDWQSLERAPLPGGHTQSQPARLATVLLTGGHSAMVWLWRPRWYLDVPLFVNTTGQDSRRIGKGQVCL